MIYPDIEGPWSARHPKGFRQIVAWSLVFFAFLAGLILLWPGTVDSAQNLSLPTPAPKDAVKPKSALLDPCGLKDAVCAGEGRVIRATVTTYQAVRAQTDADPCHTADGTDSCNPTVAIVANNCLAFGAAVKIRGEHYFVHDRMNSRYGCSVFDILTSGENYTLTNEPVTVL